MFVLSIMLDFAKFTLIPIVLVLRLEKWIDIDVRYLRDAAEDSWCAVDLNMPPEAPLPTTEELPVFEVAYQNASIC